MRKTNIVPWTKEWVKAYETEEKLLRGIFQHDLIEIHHIGSTSVPTIGYAKPIIDILMVVTNINKVDMYNESMSAAGYEAKGENGIEGRRYFPKGGDDRTHHLHIFEVGNNQINKHLDFKEYLVNHPLEAKSYGELKVKLAKQFPAEHHKYQEGKQIYVSGLAEKAAVWSSLNEM